METPRLHLITDDRVLADPGFLDRARPVLEAGRDRIAFHLRGPHQSGRHLFELAGGLLEVARATGGVVVVNDRVDVAGATGAPAVQLGRRSLSAAAARRILGGDVAMGASVHGPAEAIEAAGADWLIVGSLFASPSHPDRAGAGPALLTAVRAVSRLPLVAIGGITPERVARVCSAGAHGVAVLSGVWGSADPAGATELYLERLKAAPPAGATRVEANSHA